MRSKTFKTYLNVCLYKKRCGRYNILSRYFVGEKERISAKRKSVRYRKAAVRSCRDFQKGDLMYRHKTKKYRAAAVGAVLAAVLMLGFAGCDKLPTSSDSAATAAPTPTPEPEDLTVFAEGTTMDGIDISGMKLAEAEKVCRAAALKPYANINVTVKSGDTEMTAKGSELTVVDTLDITLTRLLKSRKAGDYEMTYCLTLKNFENELKQSNVEYVIFDKVGSNPTKPVVEEGGRFAKENGCDFIVALGGGSVMDASKAIGIMATNESDDLWDYVMFGTGKKQWPPMPSLPIVAITTTAGTGSETDGGGVITNPETQEKTGVFGTGTMPVLAIVDPELMTSVPSAFKAYQGFDALFHSTEGYISANRNEFSKMVAAEAIKNVSRNLVTSIREPENIEAMSNVAFGSYLSGIQMTVGTCVSAHPLEHALSAYHEKLPHGAGLIMISKAFYSFFINKHVCDDRFIEMAKLMGMEDASKPEDFITMLVKLQEDCNVAELKMSDYRITPEEFPKMAENARATLGINFENDMYKLTNEDCVTIYQESYK